MSLFLYVNSSEMRETEGILRKNLGMEMSLFLYGNSAEMRKNKRKSCTLNIFMPPGTIVPMGAYCFYCVRTYVRTYVRISEFG